MGEEAITAAYEAYALAIRRYVRSRGLSVEDAEDICSLVFTEAWQHYDTYEERGHMRAWLFRMAHSRIVDYRRRQTRRPQVSFDTLTSLADNGIEHRVLERDWLAGLFSHPSIPASQQRALYCRYIRDYSPEAMCQAGVAQTVSAAKALQLRGMAHVRSLVASGY